MAKAQKGSFMNAIMGQQHDQGLHHVSHDESPVRDDQNETIRTGVSRLNVAFDAQLMADMKTLASIHQVSVTQLINDEMKKAVNANMVKIQAQRSLRCE